MYGLNPLWGKLLTARNEGKRYLINQGGARSGKTTAILQNLYYIARNSKKPLIISVVSESLPHLRLGAIRDFNNILRNEGLIPETICNVTTNTYRIEKSIIEFFSADNPGKVHGPSRDILFLNEAINIPYPIAEQLFIRTSGTIFIDYNPCSSFWVHENILNLPETAYFHTTYLDNVFIPKWVKREIENRKENENWWRVYGLGEVGSLEGLIFKNWSQVEKFPENGKFHCYGQDFGFTNDPSVTVQFCLSDNAIYLDELCYNTGMTTQDISDSYQRNGLVKNVSEIFADAADPKTIHELRQKGWLIRPATKGADSVNKGIDLMIQYPMKVTSRSVNIIKELRNYSWVQDKTSGKYINKPIDTFNHAIDACRYCAIMKIAKRSFGMKKTN